MKYRVTIGAQTVEVEVEGTRVVVGGVAREAQLAPLPGTPLYHLLLAGESWTLAADALDDVGRWVLGVAGERIEVQAVDERARQAAPSGARPGQPGDRAGAGGGRGGGGGGGGGGAAGRTVIAPMPGLVVRVEVAAGQHVAAGAGLVVVEAMKMENELRAPQPGVVATVHVAVGQAVEKGAALVTLASPEVAG